MECASLKKVLHTVAKVLERVIWPIDGYVYIVTVNEECP